MSLAEPSERGPPRDRSPQWNGAGRRVVYSSVTSPRRPGPRTRRASLDACSEFARDAAPGLVRTALLLLGDRSAAEDATQAALLRVFGRWEHVTSNPSGYAAAVLVNVCRDALRRRARRPETLTDPGSFVPPPVAVSPDPSDRVALDAALAALPQFQREVVAMRYLLDLSVPETAAALQVPEGTVKSATSRAFDRLRVLLSPEEGEVHHAH